MTERANIDFHGKVEIHRRSAMLHNSAIWPRQLVFGLNRRRRLMNRSF